MMGVCCARCQPRLQEAVFTGEAQGATYTIKVAGNLGGAQRTQIQEVIEARLAVMDRTMSTYRRDSAISQFNRHAAATPFPVSAELIEIFSIAAQVSAATDGAFDVTVKPLVDAWGFGPDASRDAPPASETIQALRARVGYRKVVIDAAAGTLCKTQPDVCCDLNGIAQGYTVDKLAEDLSGLGCDDYLIELGGEVRARGHAVDGKSWRVAIEKAVTTHRAIGQITLLDDKALSTSGDYREYYEKDGRRISHTIDPATGYPVSHALASVSVIHDSCAMADAYATALMVLGPDQGYDLALKRNLAALFVRHEPAGRLSEKYTPEFAQALAL